jgi:myo-inositol-1(or 4)-monophosphatase
VVPDRFIGLANELADAARPIAARYFRTQVAIDDKTDNSPVTIADREAETAMRDLLTRHVPEHGVFGEEHGAVRTDAEYVWVLDPIDGTKSFISGMPVWGTLIALTRLGEPVFGLMHQPFMRETFSGDGLAADYRGPAGKRSLRSRSCTGLSDAILFTTSPLLMNETDRAAFRKVEATVKLSRYGGDCYAYCMLAAGHIDLVIETELKPYDILPLIPILAGAGAVVTSWDGGPAALGGRVIAAGDARVHAAALELLKS